MTLEDIKKLIETATPGPWTTDGDFPSWDQEYASSWVITKVGLWSQGMPLTGSEMCQQRDDAEFIAAARDLLPKLLKVAEAAQEHCDRWSALSPPSYDVGPFDPAYRPAGSLGLIEALAALTKESP